MSKDNYEFDHATGANLDYGFVWPLKAGENIVSSTWTPTSAGVTMDAELIAGNITSLWLSVGVIGRIYKVVNEIVTDSAPPRIDSRTIVLSCKRR